MDEFLKHLQELLDEIERCGPTGLMSTRMQLVASLVKLDMEGFDPIVEFEPDPRDWEDN